MPAGFVAGKRAAKTQVSRFATLALIAFPLDILGFDAILLLKGSGGSLWLLETFRVPMTLARLASLRNTEAKYLDPLEDTEMRILKLWRWYILCRRENDIVVGRKTIDRIKCADPGRHIRHTCARADCQVLAARVGPDGMGLGVHNEACVVTVKGAVPLLIRELSR